MQVGRRTQVGLGAFFITLKHCFSCKRIVNEEIPLCRESRGMRLWHFVSLQCLCLAYPDYPFATTIITQTLPCSQHHKVEAFVFLILCDRDGSSVLFCKEWFSSATLGSTIATQRQYDIWIVGWLALCVWGHCVCGSLCSKNEHK